MYAARQRSWSSDQETNGHGPDMLPTSSSTQSLKSARLRRPKHRSSWLRANAVGLALLAAATLIAFSVFYAIHQSAGLPHGFREEGPGGGSLRRSARMLARNDRADLRTLVIYVYSGTDPEYEENLRFFLREGVKVGRLCCSASVSSSTHSLRCMLALGNAKAR